jgi:lysophospholipase L1-like esterase
VVPQRLDLVQINKSGVLSVKKGTSVYACPWLPEPDNNCLGLAGIYIATYDSFTIADRDIFIIDPAAPVMPINGYALKNTLAKLAGHQNIKMAFFGNSVTLGADATTADSCYRNRVEKGIQQYYGVTVTEVAAYQGGITIKNGVNIFNQTILPQHPDILLIKLGLNDAAGPLGGRANNPVLEFQENMRDVVKLAKANNIEVLLVATFRPHMFFDEGARMPEYRQAVVDLAHEQGVACADVFTEWENQATHGVPSESQLHNYHNHPGVDGHRLMAATILRAFDPATVPSPVASPAFGMYTDSVWVTLATATGTAVRYTTDGGEPTESALLYSGPVKLDATTVFKFRAFEAGLTPSAVTV